MTQKVHEASPAALVAPTFTATRTLTGAGFELEPASTARDWMDQTVVRFAYRCLPLSIANQSGWFVRCPLSFTATWNGETGREPVVTFVADDPAEAEKWAPYIGERYGAGVVSFHLPYHFQTSAGLGLLLRPPANYPIPGAQGLDGLCDTSAAEIGFSADWKLTMPNQPVRFEKGAPIAQLLPMPLDYLERFSPVITRMEDHPEVQLPYAQWSANRRMFNEDPERTDMDWQKDYFQGKKLDGERVSGHRTRLSLCPFHNPPATDSAPD